MLTSLLTFKLRNTYKVVDLMFETGHKQIFNLFCADGSSPASYLGQTYLPETT